MRVLLIALLAAISYAQTDCEKKKLESEKEGLIGSFTPACESNGEYSALQCWGSTGQCWCADTKTGEELEGSKMEVGQRPNCDEFKSFEDTLCESKKQKALGTGFVGIFVPQCEDDGSWSPVQVWGSTGAAWCVNEKGEKIDGLEAMPNEEGILTCTESQPLLLLTEPLKKTLENGEQLKEETNPKPRAVLFFAFFSAILIVFGVIIYYRNQKLGSYYSDHDFLMTSGKQLGLTYM